MIAEITIITIIIVINIAVVVIIDYYTMVSSSTPLIVAQLDHGCRYQLGVFKLL